jgi:hypothetical protein
MTAHACAHACMVHVEKYPLFPTMEGNYLKRQGLTQWVSQWVTKIEPTETHCVSKKPTFRKTSSNVRNRGGTNDRYKISAAN